MRIVPGPINNVDWLYEIRNARAFAIGTDAAASVGEYSHIQLFNPAASGITMVVHRMLLGTDTNSSVQWRTYNTALTSLIYVGRNLHSGSPAAQGVIRREMAASELGTIVGWVGLAAGVAQQLLGPWSFVLEEGEGLNAMSILTNENVVGYFEWIEV